MTPELAESSGDRAGGAKEAAFAPGHMGRGEGVDCGALVAQPPRYKRRGTPALGELLSAPSR